MDDLKKDADTPPSAATDVTSIVRQALEEFSQREQSRNEPAYKAELLEERRRREQLERRLNELVEENRRSKLIAEEAQSSSAIRAELQSWWDSQVDSSDDPFAAPKPPAGTIFDVVPVMDSLSVTTALVAAPPQADELVTLLPAGSAPTEPVSASERAALYACPVTSVFHP